MIHKCSKIKLLLTSLTLSQTGLFGKKIIYDLNAFMTF